MNHCLFLSDYWVRERVIELWVVESLFFFTITEPILSSIYDSLTFLRSSFSVVLSLRFLFGLYVWVRTRLLRFLLSISLLSCLLLSLASPLFKMLSVWLDFLLLRLSQLFGTCVLRLCLSASFSSSLKSNLIFIYELFFVVRRILSELNLFSSSLINLS